MSELLILIKFLLIMKRVTYYKGTRAKNIFLLSLGVLTLLIGIIGLLGAIFSIKWLNDNFGKWNIVTYLLIGSSYLATYYSIMRKKRKFIEWDDEIVRLGSPGKDKVEIINVADIESVEIKIYDITIKLKDSSTRKLTMEGLSFKEIQLIKENFRKLSS